MGLLCFPKKDTNPPLCGIHHVQLVQEEIPIDFLRPNSMPIICYVCPVSREVVPDPERPNR
jgi:hypothetical protein